MWRLERLLGDACGKDKMSAQPLSDSICTEDFVRRFSEEMVDDGREQQINYPNTSEQVSQKAQREERKGRNDLSVLNEKRGAENSCSSTQKNTDSEYYLPSPHDCKCPSVWPQTATTIHFPHACGFNEQ